LPTVYGRAAAAGCNERQRVARLTLPPTVWTTCVGQANADEAGSGHGRNEEQAGRRRPVFI